MTINRVTLVGRLGKDPQHKELSNGNHVCSFSLATNDNQKINGEWQKVTDWHNIVVFGNQAQACANYIRKGSQVYIEGKIKNESYEKDGETKYITKIIAQDVKFLDSKSDNQRELKEINVSIPAASTEPTFDADDLPF